MGIVGIPPEGGRELLAPYGARAKRDPGEERELLPPATKHHSVRGLEPEIAEDDEPEGR